MNTVLIIDTSDNKKIRVGLKDYDKEHIVERVLDKQKAQAVLPLINKLLKERKLTLKDISAIQVNPGPGSFTGLRVGIAIANTLGTFLQIPINGKKIGEMVTPIYT